MRCLTCSAKESPTAEIAQTLFLGEATVARAGVAAVVVLALVAGGVKIHVARVLTKLQLRDRVQAVVSPTRTASSIETADTGPGQGSDSVVRHVAVEIERASAVRAVKLSGRQRIRGSA